MYVTEEQLKEYTCGLDRAFLAEYVREKGPDSFMEKAYDTNALLLFLLEYPEANDKTKQRFYYICKRKYGDVPAWICRKYDRKFGNRHCGNAMSNSYYCARSNQMSDCVGMEDSLGCHGCRFGHHMIYCCNQRHQSYMAFNKKVSKKRFDEMMKMFPDEIAKCPEFDVELYGRALSEIERTFRPRKLKDA